MLGLHASSDMLRHLFDEFDSDGSDAISFRELNRQLRRDIKVIHTPYPHTSPTDTRAKPSIFVILRSFHSFPAFPSSWGSCRAQAISDTRVALPAPPCEPPQVETRRTAKQPEETIEIADVVALRRLVRKEIMGFSNVQVSKDAPPPFPGCPRRTSTPRSPSPVPPHAQVPEDKETRALPLPPCPQVPEEEDPLTGMPRKAYEPHRRPACVGFT